VTSRDATDPPGPPGDPEAYFRHLVERAFDPVAVVAADGRILYVSPNVERLTGRTPEELAGTDAFRDVHPDDKERCLATFAGLLAEPDRPVSAFFRVGTAAGEWRLVEAYARNLLADPTIRGVVVNWRDVTERQEMERRLVEAQKLESLGVLAGGLAHDFNNLLTGVLGNAGLARADLPPGSPALACLEQIEEAGLRAAELCRQMLAYAGKGRFVVAPADLSAVVHETAPLLRLSLPPGARLELRLAAGLPPVLADSSQLRQVVMSLVQNAGEALADGAGVVAVETARLRAGPDDLAGGPLGAGLPEGEYAALTVSDSGCGMSEEVRRRIFEPFFSTKFTGRGLGLAAVLGIVRAHRGALRVDSRPGAGSTFRLLFPGQVWPAPPPPPPPPARGGTVLVIDDEEAVRQVAARILRSAGLRAEVARDGREGLERLAALGDEVRLVLLDLTMPGLGGEGTYRELRRLRPAVPVVLMSGFSEGDLSERFASAGLAGFLQKPFRPDDLLRRVRAALGG
jgi:PAS domain S-box-containing protein